MNGRTCTNVSIDTLEAESLQVPVPILQKYMACKFFVTFHTNLQHGCDAALQFGLICSQLIAMSAW